MRVFLNLVRLSGYYIHTYIHKDIWSTAIACYNAIQSANCEDWYVVNAIKAIANMYKPFENYLLDIK